MYIHIGAGYNVRDKQIIGCFDMDGKWDSAVTKEFLKNAEKSGREYTIIRIKDIDISQQLLSFFASEVDEKKFQDFAISRTEDYRVFLYEFIKWLYKSI